MKFIEAVCIMLASERGGFILAIYHSTVRCISRGQGQSLVKMAAYIGGKRFYDEYCGMSRYRPRYDVFSRRMILPPDAPSEYDDEQIFVTELDRAEKRKDAQTARELIFSLPVELLPTEQKELAFRCIDEFWVSRGMCAYACIHDDRDKDNPHVHALLSTRDVDKNGFSKNKNRDWNDKELVLEWRVFLANAVNQALEKKGCKTRVSHLSYEAQGLKKTPTKYLGPRASALERDGFTTDRGDENRAIMAERARKLEAKREMEAKKARRKRRRRGRTY